MNRSRTIGIIVFACIAAMVVYRMDGIRSFWDYFLSRSWEARRIDTNKFDPNSESDGLESVEALELIGDPIKVSDCSFLRQCTSLRSLTILSGDPVAGDFDPVSGDLLHFIPFPAMLKHLWVNRAMDVTDKFCDFMSKCTGLERLSLKSMQCDSKNFAFLEKMPNLRRLELRNCVMARGLGILLRKTKRLGSINLSYCKNVDVFLAGLPVTIGLRAVNLMNSDVSSAGLLELMDHHGLKTVWVTDSVLRYSHVAVAKLRSRGVLVTSDT